MAKAYIANRPVRFDRNYNVGEKIPAEVIAPQMRRKLAEMGRILCIDVPDNENGEQKDEFFGAESAPEGGQQNDGEEENAAEETDEFVCEICGKMFKSQNGLAAHLRVHKE